MTTLIDKTIAQAAHDLACNFVAIRRGAPGLTKVAVSNLEQIVNSPVLYGTLVGAGLGGLTGWGSTLVGPRKRRRTTSDILTGMLLGTTIGGGLGLMSANIKDVFGPRQRFYHPARGTVLSLKPGVSPTSEQVKAVEEYLAPKEPGVLHRLTPAAIKTTLFQIPALAALWNWSKIKQWAPIAIKEDIPLVQARDIRAALRGLSTKLTGKEIKELLGTSEPTKSEVDKVFKTLGDRLKKELTGISQSRIVDEIRAIKGMPGTWRSRFEMLETSLQKLVGHESAKVSQIFDGVKKEIKALGWGKAEQLRDWIEKLKQMSSEELQKVLDKASKGKLSPLRQTLISEILRRGYVGVPAEKVPPPLLRESLLHKWFPNVFEERYVDPKTWRGRLGYGKLAALVGVLSLLGLGAQHLTSDLYQRWVARRLVNQLTEPVSK